jgi:hypothetical protein
MKRGGLDTGLLVTAVNIARSGLNWTGGVCV